MFSYFNCFKLLSTMFVVLYFGVMCFHSFRALFSFVIAIGPAKNYHLLVILNLIYMF